MPPKAKATTTATAANSPKAGQVTNLAMQAISKLTKNAQTPIKFYGGPLPCASTGSIAIDNLIGGNLAPDGTGPICAGFPRKHYSEVFGAEGSGKTTLALQAIAKVQAEGGSAMFLDFEHALHHGYAKSLGVKFDESLLLYQPDTLEQGFELIRIGIRAGMDIIALDSIAAMIPDNEAEKGYSEADMVGIRARRLSSLLPKIVKELSTTTPHNPKGTALVFINQVRSKIGGGPGAATEDSSGGRALKFYAYLRLSVTRTGSEKVSRKNAVSGKLEDVPFGNKTKIKVIKCKVDAKQGSWADVFIRYGQGIDEEYTMIESAVAHGLAKKSGAFYDFEGERFQGRETFRKALRSNPALWTRLQDKVLGALRSQMDCNVTDDDTDVDLDNTVSVGELSLDISDLEAEGGVVEETTLPEDEVGE